MKKILIFFIFLILIGCSSIREKNSSKISIIDCPKVFFSAENKVYIKGKNESLNLKEIDFKSTLNNYGFVNNCYKDADNNNYLLELLIVVEPINPKDSNINLPIFVIMYDKQDKIIDKQYFRIQDNLKYSEVLSGYEITDVNGKLTILLEKDVDLNSITIGFINIK